MRQEALSTGRKYKPLQEIFCTLQGPDRDGISLPYNAMNTENYIPGVCNIGPEEITRRRRIGYAGLALCFLWIATVEGFDLQTGYRFFLIIPAAVMFFGFFQARQKFCFRYAITGVHRFQRVHQVTKVEVPDFLKQDRRTAWILLAKVLVSAAALTLLYYFMPFS